MSHYPSWRPRWSLLRVVIPTILLSMVVMSSSFPTTTTGAAPRPPAPASSTLSLLEHVNFNIPHHEYSLDLYLDVLGFGLDPRVAVNLLPDSVAQFFVGRAGFGSVAVATKFISPGVVGTRTTPRNSSTDTSVCAMLPSRVCRPVTPVVLISRNPAGNGTISFITRRRRRLLPTAYHPKYTSRIGMEISFTANRGYKTDTLQQPVVQQSDVDTFGDVALRYGVGATKTSECVGIDYVEFECQVHTAAKIANFYAIRAGTKTEEAPPTTVAYISIGTIDPTTHEAEQYLIFRETCDHVPPTDGHHIALYLGSSSTHDETDDHDFFARAFHQAQRRGLLSTHWRDTVAVYEWDTAQAECQFRIHDIVDVDTGDLLFRLEHELRSIHHPTWPGEYSTAGIGTE